MRCEPLALEDPPLTSSAGRLKNTCRGQSFDRIDYFDVNSSWGWFFRSSSINELSVCNRNLGSQLLVLRLLACFATLIPQRGYNEALFFVLFIVDRSQKNSSHQSSSDLFQAFLGLY